MRSIALLTFVAAFCGACNSHSAPPNAGPSSGNGHTATAEPSIVQGSSQEDRDLREKIQEKLVASDLSAEAQNVSVVTQQGKVLVTGSVRTKAERSRVEEFAKEAAGPDNVASKLEVLPAPSDEEFTIRLE